MYEANPCPPRARSAYSVNDTVAAIDQVAQGGVDVRGVEGQMMESRSSPLDEATDRALVLLCSACLTMFDKLLLVRIEFPQEFQFKVTDSDEKHLQATNGLR